MQVVIAHDENLRDLCCAKVQETLAQRREEFSKTRKQWLDEQTADFERNGLWSDGLVAWRDNG